MKPDKVVIIVFGVIAVIAVWVLYKRGTFAKIMGTRETGTASIYTGSAELGAPLE